MDKKSFALLCLLSAAFSAVAAPAPKPRVQRFVRYVDATEGAFLVLVPQGWTTRGGMVRVDALSAGGAGNAVAAKIDFSVQKDAEGRVGIRWLPAINYAQPSPSNAMLGGNWNGMPVVAMPSAADYATGILFPSLRPRAKAAKVVAREARPDVAASLRQLPVGKTMTSQGAFYVADAATVTVAYEEGGVRYKELLFVALEGYSMMGAALWSNPFTIAARAPEAEYEAWGPVAKAVVNSFALNPLWLEAEWAGQARRSDLVAATLRDLARVDAEIARSRSETMAAINREQYLALTGQEVYVNPHTGKQELGSGEWKHRWENDRGEIIYTDDGAWDPARDPAVKSTGFKRSSPAKR